MEDLFHGTVLTHPIRKDGKRKVTYRVSDNTYGIADLQTKMLEILEELIRVCEENNLTYFACGGTCIGALRHNGFIPWDDDLDVFMPRSDYEKLWSLRHKFQDGKYKLCRTDAKKNYHHRVQQLVDLNTTFINKRSVNEDIEHGVYIDILPLDACAPTKAGRIKQIFQALLFSVYNVQCLPEFHGGSLFRTAISIALKAVPSKDIRYKIWTCCEKNMTKYDWSKETMVVELTASTKVMQHPYPKEWFDGIIKHKFEDIEINLPSGVDQYLKQVFGDYMTLPPVSERHPRHNTVLIDLNNCYEIYKGKYYCNDK